MIRIFFSSFLVILYLNFIPCLPLLRVILRSLFLLMYDLSQDSEEEDNVATNYPDTIEKIQAFMKAAHRENAVFPFQHESD
ncbi:hypothetical protein H8S90_15565 [Olivibacter sp. SDN3]|uniref:hypothetical protein n=1 Tax=Olivibacter sp. SDN3 TaxID=2764720 RepID=UPI0016511D91|nr:hypothetical protein [Olivibacter sp. SDN3]QNL48214.1 hypothetical protein H8S90_15565 [Olivibacter sp. SDN3]